MNMLFINNFVYNLWFLRYREYPYSDTVRNRLLSPNGLFLHLNYSKIILPY